MEKYKEVILLLQHIPVKNWKDNLGFIVKEIKIADGGLRLYISSYLK